MLTPQLPPPPPRIFCFISYSRSEREFAIKLVSDLRKNRVKVWRDEDDIPAGASWEDEIKVALRNCTHVLFIATSNSVDSPTVLDEVSFALDQKKSAIPLIPEECDLPLRVHRAQWVDFQGEYADGFNILLRDLGVGQGQQATSERRETSTSRTGKGSIFNLVKRLIRRT